VTRTSPRVGRCLPAVRALLPRRPLHRSDHSRRRLRASPGLRAVPGLVALAGLAGAACFAYPGAGAHHRVTAGETLTSIAAQEHTSVRQLQQLNHLTGDRILIGQLLALPGNGGTKTTAPGRTGTVIVGAGDTLTTIAARAGTTVSRLRQLNPRLAGDTILLGAPLTVPAAPLTLATGGGAIGRSRAELATRDVPTHSQARAMITSEARRQGLDPALALAIAWQESGDEQTMVSSTDAVGVMQLMPGTATWVGDSLLHRSIDRYDAQDNIAAGVAYLRVLTSVTDTSSAIAGYYQGLASVQRIGLLPDTGAYVRSVLALRARS